MNELLFWNLVRSLNARRVANLLKTSLSFVLSTLLRKPIVWGIPPILTIEPTNQCNLRCPLCTTGSGEMLRPAGRMSLETFRKIMDAIGDDIFFLLIYHQGEPYMNKHFLDFVRLAKERNIYVTTSTNGHFFTPYNVEETIASGLDSMIVSIDGSTQESYERYRVGGNLQRVIDGTRLLMETRQKQGSRTPNVALQFLVMKHNEAEIPRMRALAKELGVDRFLVKNIEVRTYQEALEWLPAEDQFRRYQLQENDFVVKNNKKSCPRPWLSTLVNWDGTFVPCCFDKNGAYPIGNISEAKQFEDIWLGQPIRQFRERLITDRQSIDICRNCNQGLGSFLPERLWRKKVRADAIAEDTAIPVLNRGGRDL